MDRSIRYVRERKIAPLLNDMLTHLLLTQAEDPLGALIRFLELKQANHLAGVLSPESSSDHSPTAAAAAASSQKAKAMISTSPRLGGALPPSSSSRPPPPSLPSASSYNSVEDILKELVAQEQRAMAAVEIAAVQQPRRAEALPVDAWLANSRLLCTTVVAALKAFGCDDSSSNNTNENMIKEGATSLSTPRKEYVDPHPLNTPSTTAVTAPLPQQQDEEAELLLHGRAPSVDELFATLATTEEVVQAFHKESQWAAEALRKQNEECDAAEMIRRAKEGQEELRRLVVAAAAV